jgi:single-strand DNA-binding protein
MRKGVNKVTVLGNMGADPEIRRTPSGDCHASFSVAYSESWTDKNTGEKKEITEWIRCVAWRKLAEIIEQYVKKGSKVYLEGKLQTRSWEQDGSKRYATEVVVEELQMLDSKPQDQRSPESNTKVAAQKSDAHKAQEKHMEQPNFDDDIPF